MATTEAAEYLRVVALRRGKLRPSEFMLRGGERGLSLFGHVEQPGPKDILETVREAGKQGDLHVAVIAAGDLRSIGLAIAKAPGNTPSADINAIHYEARIPWFRRPLLWVRGMRSADYFNRELAPRLCVAARLLDLETRT